jgi:hypothetical protein
MQHETTTLPPSPPKGTVIIADCAIGYHHPTGRQDLCIVNDPEATSLQASYGCGPTDGPWANIRVTTTRSTSVVASVTFEGHELGRSQTMHTSPGVPATFGFDLVLPSGAYGHRGTATLADVDRGDAPLAHKAIALRLPGMSCG